MTTLQMTPNQKSHIDWQTKNIDDLQKEYEKMMVKVEKRASTCRKSSKQYYHKTYKLSENPTAQEVEKNKKVLDKRDAYQKSYYEENKDMIKHKQKLYREKKKAERDALKNTEA